MSKILLIDDLKDNLIALKAIINDEFPDANVLTALDGTSGIQLAKSNNPDLILLDILMPNMDGFEVCRLLKDTDETKDIPVVFVTALKESRATKIRALQVGAEGFLTKPIDEVELTAQINAMLKIKAANDFIRNKNERLEKLVQKRTLKLQNEINKRKKSEKRYKNLFDEAVDGIMLTDFEGNIEQVNNSFAKMHGYSIKELSTMNLNNLTLLDKKTFDKKAVEMKKMLQKDSIKFEAKHYHKDGHAFPLNVTAKLIKIEEKTYVLCFHQDLTTLRKKEKDLTIALQKAQESDHLKSAFIANMSHEIRTPMNGILGFSNLLKDPGLTGNEQQKYINVIERSGARMLNTINDIIDISKIDSNQMLVSIKTVNISEEIIALFNFFKLQCKEKGLVLTIDGKIQSENCIINTDKVKFNSIFTNLIKNAIKYTDKGAINIGCSNKGNYLEFYVKDTGSGIPAHRQEAIFNRFEQADIEDKRALQGSGLGLAISKAYVEMLGGTIWVESEVNKGSTFYFTLPCNASTKNFETAEIEKTNINKSTETKKYTILIVEDDKPSEMLLNLMIESNSKKIFISKTGKEAIATCKKNSDIDLILMDIKMPGMNGLEATQEIRKFNKDVIIIAQTAYALQGDEKKALEAGCNAYLTKPIQKEKLANLIYKLLK